MADQAHLQMITRNVAEWNDWRKKNPDLRPNLIDANLRGIDLTSANLTKVNLSGANLSSAILRGADLTDSFLVEANLQEADLNGGMVRRRKKLRTYLDRAKLHGADLSRASFRYASMQCVDLTDAKLTYVDFRWSDLTEAVFARANLRWANLSGANCRKADFRCASLMNVQMVDTLLSQANLEGCRVYGLSAWNLTLTESKQSNLIVTHPEEPSVTVDNIEIAQFIYLLLNNAKIRDVIDTIGKKAILILGRFTDERKTVLDAIRNELRKHDYLPILFDFDKPESRDLTETVSILAHMSRFIIADITDARSIPQELQAIVPHLPSVPVQPLILNSAYQYGMFEHFRRYPWVLAAFQYDSIEQLLSAFAEHVIAPAEARIREITSTP
jgi:uncharacterized protein YjbI with pentapeptide repeats